MCVTSLCTRGALDTWSRRRSTAALGGNLDNEELVRNWHAAIVRDCREILGRDLTEPELAFIQSRGALIALEFIEDTVHSFRGVPNELERFLRSEA
jgi:hypothetical protein